MSFISDTKNNRIAGILGTRHLLTETEYKERFVEKQDIEENSMLLLVELCAIVEKEATIKMPELTEPKKTADIVLLGVHSDYRGRNIANNLVRLSLQAIKALGYAYASLLATSHFSSRISEKNGFTSIHEIDVRNWIWKGEKVLQNMREPHGYYKYWVKKL